MAKLTKSQFTMAKRIWATQRKHKNINFVPKDFNNMGKLTMAGKARIKKKRR